MKLKLSDWASIAEILSGIAVAITLLMLFAGIRENSNLTRASMYSDQIDSLDEISRSIYADPELARLLTRI